MHNPKTTGLNVFVLLFGAEANSRKSAMKESRLFKASTEQLHGPVRKDKPFMGKLSGVDT
jgi:hypothetical protein